MCLVPRSSAILASCLSRLLQQASSATVWRFITFRNTKASTKPTCVLRQKFSTSKAEWAGLASCRYSKLLAPPQGGCIPIRAASACAYSSEMVPSHAVNEASPLAGRMS